MSKVRIVQLLCPSRHCILASAYESSDEKEIPGIAEILRKKADWMIQAGINPWCGICRSRDWHCEDRPTKFQTMAEALPHLKKQEEDMAATREYFRASRG